MLPRPHPRYKGGVLLLNYGGVKSARSGSEVAFACAIPCVAAPKLEVRRGGAPRSQLYESRASLTTLADRKWKSREDSNPRHAHI